MKGHILYMSLRVIRPGEELTVDYNFTKHRSTALCACGSRQCRASWRPRAMIRAHRWVSTGSGKLPQDGFQHPARGSRARRHER
jgi:hypothetical protein